MTKHCKPRVCSGYVPDDGPGIKAPTMYAAQAYSAMAYTAFRDSPLTI